MLTMTIHSALGIVIFLIFLCARKCACSTCLGATFDHSSGVKYCFWVLSTNQPPASTDTICGQDGGRIALIPDQETNDFVWNYLSGIGHSGLPAINVKNYYINNQYELETLDGQPLTYSNWEGGQPQPGEECVCIRPSTGKWFDISCGQYYGGMCSKEMPPLCIGAILYHSSGQSVCFWVLSSNQPPATTDIKCAEDEGRIALIKDQETNDFVWNYLSGIGHSGLPAINVKNYYINNQYELETLDGQPLTYSNWEGGQPQPGEECVCIRPSTGKWFDISCGQYYGGLCSEELEPPCPGSILNHSSGKRVCFWVLATNQPPESTNTICAQDGGQIALITDSETNNFVWNYLTSISHSGLPAINVKNYYINNQYELETLDGQPLTYSNWEGGQPQPGEECVCISPSTGKWFDISCGQYYGGLCSRELNGPVITTTTPTTTTTETTTTTTVPTTTTAYVIKFDPTLQKPEQAEIQENLYLNVTPVQTFTSRNEIDCTRRCLTNGLCLSVNMKHNGTRCQLNNESHLTLPSFLIHQLDSVYVYKNVMILIE